MNRNSLMTWITCLAACGAIGIAGCGEQGGGGAAPTGSDAKDALDDVSNTAQKQVDKVKDGVDEVKKVIDDNVDAAKKKMDEVKSDVEEKAGAVRKQAEELLAKLTSAIKGGDIDAAKQHLGALDGIKGDLPSDLQSQVEQGRTALNAAEVVKDVPKLPGL
ncbi:MAG: hypothetical protein CMJ18_12690 [Phycisphaeraceae bacterium]|nr:hypothetical protein [Phycisphaeraceae bacterium]